MGRFRKLKFTAKDFDKTATAAAELLVELYEKHGDENHECFELVMDAADELWREMLHGEITRDVLKNVVCVTPEGAARIILVAKPRERELVIKLPQKPLYVHFEDEEEAEA